MNKITLLFLCLFFSLSQKAVSGGIANITIEFEEQSLHSALCKLNEVSWGWFIFQDEVSDTLIVASQRFEDKSLYRILDTLLANTGYSYVIIEDSPSYDVIIYKMSTTIQCQEPTPITVTGQVVDIFGDVSIFTREEIRVISRANSEPILRTDLDLNGNFVITVDDPNTYLVLVPSWFFFPRVVHIKDAELIQLKNRGVPLDGWVTIGCICRNVSEPNVKD